MRILITGTSSGLGQELANRLHSYTVVALTRQQLDLSNINSVIDYDPGICDILINCAGTGIGGKLDFINHQNNHVINILNTNLVAPIILSKSVLSNNPNCKIVNITSTNNNRYYANDLVYSLSKQALSSFGNMLNIEYSNVRYLEVRLGLTKTNFNNNRYINDPARLVDIYQNQHLTVNQAADVIVPAVFNDSIKFIEVAV